MRQIKKLIRLGLHLSRCIIQDPKVAAWLIDPEALGNLNSVVQTYLPELLDPNRPRDLKFNSYYAFELMRALKKRLKSINLLGYFECVEMPVHFSLESIERNGIHFDSNCFETIMRVFETRIAEIETLGNTQLNYIDFSWDSNRELFEMLFLELELVHPDYPDIAAMDHKKRFITKSILDRIKTDDPFPSYITERNRLKFITAQIIEPISIAYEKNKKGGRSKIFCCHDPFTVSFLYKYQYLVNWKNCDNGPQLTEYTTSKTIQIK